METSGEEGGSDGCMDIEASAVAVVGKGDMFSWLARFDDVEVVLRLNGVLRVGDSMSCGGAEGRVEMEVRLLV